MEMGVANGVKREWQPLGSAMGASDRLQSGCLVVLVFSLSVLLVGCVTTRLHDRSWVEVQTTHYDIVSSLEEEDTTRLAQDIEVFRRSVEFLLGRAIPNPPVRTRIFAFDGRRIGSPFRVRGQSSYLIPRMRGDILVLRTGGGWQGDATAQLRLQYAQRLLRGAGMLRLPAWYDEGLAQLASTLVIRAGRTEVGILQPDHLQLLRERTWVPVRKVLSAQDLSRWSRLEREMFGAESWAIAHLIRVGEMRRRQSGELIAGYLDLVAKGESLADAANRVLGDEFAGALRTHVNAAEMDSISVRQFKEAPRFESRALTAKEVLEELGGLSLALARADTARRYFAAALAIEAQSARSHSGRASADALDELRDEAELQFATALEIAPLDPLIHLARANALSAAARVSTDPERERLVGLARGAYERSLTLADTIPETHVMLAASYLIDGQDAVDGVAHLDRASALLPASLEIQLMRARLELSRGNSGIARAIAIQVLSRARITSTIAAARTLLQEIDARLAGH